MARADREACPDCAGGALVPLARGFLGCDHCREIFVEMEIPALVISIGPAPSAPRAPVPPGRN